MGIFVKRNHEKEYLYMFVGKSHYFLGRKDDLENLDLKNLYKTTRIIDRNFENTLTKYLRDMHGNADLMPDAERKEYISKSCKP